MSDEYRRLIQDALQEARRARARIQELERHSEPRAATDRHAAIVGLGCRLPAGIEDPEAAWNFLVRSGDAIAPAPIDRWRPDELAELPPPGAYLDDPYAFDAAFFHIAPREARLVDPQQRLVLEVAHATIEHAGLAPRSLRGANIGVYTGISTDDWSMHLARHLPIGEVEGASGPGTNACAAAGRVSFALGLQGPSLAVNTACSSSLVALHLAKQALRAGDCEMALVLGVNAILSPFSTLAFQRGGMLAPDGRCKTFAAGANGYGRGEGCVGVLLATPAAVAKHRLRVHAELLGSAVNQDGATAGLTVPSGPAQQRVLRAALADAGIGALDVQMVEAHGTGTLLGDPIEGNALAAVHGPGRGPAQPLHLAAVKTNFGHLEAAAGLLSVLKVVLQLERRTIVPHLHGEPPNPHLQWPTLPFVVPRAAMPWPATQRAIAGVSSFSFTGTNAHVLLAAATTPAPLVSPSAVEPPTMCVLPLSARTPSALRASCARWAAHLSLLPAPRLVDVCATAAMGRSAMRARAAVCADSVAQAIERLHALANGERPEGTWMGLVAGDPPDVDLGIDAAPAAIAQAFVAGAEVPWSHWLPADWQRLALPTYPFQRRRFVVASRPMGIAIADPLAAASTSAEPTDPAALRARIDAALPSTRSTLLAEYVRATAATVLRLVADEVAIDEPLAEYGFDSLRAAELARTLELDLGVALPFVELVDGACALDVGAAIARRWPTTTTVDPGALLRSIASMSPDEVARRLRETGDG